MTKQNEKHFRVTKLAKGRNKGKFKVELMSSSKVMFTTDEPKKRAYDVLRFCRTVNPAFPIRGLG